MSHWTQDYKARIAEEDRQRPYITKWWDDAIDEANHRARDTGRRHRVTPITWRKNGTFLGCSHWMVSEVASA